MKAFPQARFAGITLIEIIAVLVILLFLISMLTPAVTGAMESSQAAAEANDRRYRQRMLEQYSNRPGNAYDKHSESNFKDPSIPGHDFSTFSIDVDTASYADVRAQLRNHNMLPHPQTVRIEEMINYFDYHYEAPTSLSNDAFRCHVASSQCPWQAAHRLLRIGIKGKELAPSERPASNLVFLIDSSGSMSHSNKMGLLKRSFKLLVNQLDERDTVSIVTYAGSSGIALAPCSADNKRQIINALNNLSAQGSTNGASGIQLAYQLAQAHYKEGGNNRIILATDGDFNVGMTGRHALLELIKSKAQLQICLSIHGYGMDNRQDGMLEEISNNGNGSYAFIDNLNEANKVMVKDLSGSLLCIAKDVKIQCVFNPHHVAAWRLIGYENRVLDAQDFKDDSKDAGDIGAGHNVTALYEIIPKGVALPTTNNVDPNPFITPDTAAKQATTSNSKPTDEQAAAAWLQLRIRYKEPDGFTSKELSQDFQVQDHSFASMDENFRWSASISAFGMLLTESTHKGLTTWPMLLEIARKSRGMDRYGYRAECIQLMECARDLQQTLY